MLKNRRTGVGVLPNGDDAWCTAGSYILGMIGFKVMLQGIKGRMVGFDVELIKILLDPFSNLC